MLRFRNPGTQYETQIQVFKELYKQYKDVDSFSLDDMASTIAQTRLMTAYGYAGNEALALSKTDNDSLNSTKMNAKMYAEVFRILGWIASVGESSYPLTFTYIGRHAAESVDVLPLYEQCVLGINNPQEIMDVKYDEKVRFFKTALICMQDLGGIMYKHEFCLGPMSIDDTDNSQYNNMLKALEKIRGSYLKYKFAYKKLCESLNVKETLPDNSTRLPIAFMKTCGWVESIRTKAIYPPKSLDCLKLTEHGKDVIDSVSKLKDLRLEEYNTCPEVIQHALIRLGIYTMLKRAGYDISPVQRIIEEDSIIAEDILNGQELLFSPYQTLKLSVVNKALGIQNRDSSNNNNTSFISAITRPLPVLENVSVNLATDFLDGADNEIASFKTVIMGKHLEGKSLVSIVDEVFLQHVEDDQTIFYPFVAMLFRIIGFKNCFASRAGDNGNRWDLMIIDPYESIPIEIKSPTEEKHISLKAIRQALENKVILLSRKTYNTFPDTTTLTVGYYYPNDRAEVANLISDFKNAYGYKIGVIDFKTLLIIAASVIINQKTVDIKQIQRLEGFANATFE